MQIYPNSRRVTLLATLVTPLSHHDPAAKNRSNISPLLRNKMLVDRQHSFIPDAHQIHQLVQKFPVPDALADVYQSLSVVEFLAVVALKLFIEAYNTAEGVGLFAGVQRYGLLESRARFNAIRSPNMFAWWGGLSADLQVNSIPFRGDVNEHTALLTMPSALAGSVLAQIADNTTSCIMLARVWSEVRGETSTRRLTLPDFNIPNVDHLVVEVPAYSANSARHEMVREPGMWHLLHHLQLTLPELPDGTAALLYNGGDLNTTEPPDAFKLIRQIVSKYPLLGLIGGATSGFILGASDLEVSSWLVASEYQDALNMFGVVADVSALELIDRHELTRHTTRRVDGSPMPFGFEVLIAGTRVLIDLRLRPYASDLEAGALAAAISTYMNADSTIGGQSARGYGLTSIQMLDTDWSWWQARQQEYETYLADNALELRDGLLRGTYGTARELA